MQEYVPISKVSLRFSEPHKKSCILRSFFVSCVNLGQKCFNDHLFKQALKQFSFFNESLFILAVMESKSLGIFLFCHPISRIGGNVQKTRHFQKKLTQIFVYSNDWSKSQFSSQSIWIFAPKIIFNFWQSSNFDNQINFHREN